MKGGLNADTAASSKRTKTMKGGLNADTAASSKDKDEIALLFLPLEMFGNALVRGRTEAAQMMATIGAKGKSI